MNILISHYKEDLSWTNSINTNKHNLFIYNKIDDVNDVNIDGYILPNIGRESYVYSYYISTNYNTINKNEYTIFLQGFPFDHLGSLCYLFTDIFDSHEDYQQYACFAKSNQSTIAESKFAEQHMNLCRFFINYINNFNEKNLPNFIAIGTKHQDNGYFLQKKALANYLNIIPREDYFIVGAQFIVKHTMILDKTKSFWDSLFDVHRLNNSVMCSTTMPYITERLWPSIFLHNTESI